MKFTVKILLVLFLQISFFVGRSQNESLLQPFSNPMLLNPAFIGMNNETNLHVGNQYYRVDSTKAYNLLYITYDTYSNKLNGGIGLIFQQGIIGHRNISTNELGFAYSGVPKKTQNGNFRFAVNTNFLLATKQLYVHSLDGIMLNSESPPNPPGSDFFQYLLLKPRLAVLWESRVARWGLTAGYPLKVNLGGSNEDIEEVVPANFTFYISGNREGYKKGLRTKPFVFVPELIVFYQENWTMARFHAYMKHTDNTFGLFIQSDITNNIHCLGGTAGISSGNIRIDLSAGAGIPGISDSVGICGELTLQIKVPRVDYSKINPWAPH